LGADLQLQIADLPAQGRLGRVKPPLGRQREASFFSHRNEIAQMTQLHAQSMLSRYDMDSTKSFSSPLGLPKSLVAKLVEARRIAQSA